MHDSRDKDSRKKGWERCAPGRQVPTERCPLNNMLHATQRATPSHEDEHMRVVWPAKSVVTIATSDLGAIYQQTTGEYRRLQK